MAGSGRPVEVEFHIKEDGRVEFRVKGAPGASCLDVAEAFEVLGETLERERTPEFYEQGGVSAVETRRKS